MKKRFKFSIFLAIAGLAFTSCDRSLLSPIPETSVSDASSFSTVSRIQSQRLSIYQALKDGRLYGGRFLIYGDIRANDFINQTNNLVTGSDVWSLNPTNSATAVLGLWASSYIAINRANIFIEGMESTGNAVVGQELGTRYIGEAKLIRALTYLSLLQYYARPYADGNGSKPGVPLRLTGIKGAGFSDLARSTVAEVYAQILKDLNDAETALPSTYTTASDNTTLAHKNTAIALKVRVYLAMQNYASVVTEANKIVTAAAPFSAPTGVKHELQASIATVFTNYTTTESIFSMPMTTGTNDSPGTQNQLAYYFTPPAASGGVGTGEYALNATGIVADTTWKKTDARRGFVLTSAAGTANEKLWLMKYKVASPYTDYVPVIRYSEVLLSLAEAKVRSGNTVDAQAVALLNAVRTRSDATTTFTATSFATSAALLDAILAERRIEFLGEGIRNFDIMRLLQTIPAKGSITAKAPADNGYIWPISADELSLNSLATDN